MPDRVHSKEGIEVESGSETTIDLLTYRHADCGITNQTQLSNTMKKIAEIISEIEGLDIPEGGRCVYERVLREGLGEEGMYFIDSICDRQLQIDDTGKIYRISDRDLGFAGRVKVLALLRWMQRIGFETKTSK